MNQPANDTLDVALAAAYAAAPHLDRASLTAAVTAATTAATTALAGQIRSMQVALRASTASAENEKAVLVAAQLWAVKNDRPDIADLKSILGGHILYGFDPEGVNGLDTETVAEVAAEAYLREFARAERLQRDLELAGR